MQRVPPRAVVSKAGYSARVGNRVDVADLERYFAVNGYQRASTVSERGEFAIRGGVIDVTAPLPPHMQQTWDMFGFDVKRFDSIDDAPE